MVVVSSVEGKEKNTYEVREFDKGMNAVGKPIVITNEFEKRNFNSRMYYTLPMATW